MQGTPLGARAYTARRTNPGNRSTHPSRACQTDQVEFRQSLAKPDAITRRRINFELAAGQDRRWRIGRDIRPESKCKRPIAPATSFPLGRIRSSTEAPRLLARSSNQTQKPRPMCRGFCWQDDANVTYQTNREEFSLRRFPLLLPRSPIFDSSSRSCPDVRNRSARCVDTRRDKWVCRPGSHDRLAVARQKKLMAVTFRSESAALGAAPLLGGLHRCATSPRPRRTPSASARRPFPDHHALPATPRLAWQSH